MSDLLLDAAAEAGQLAALAAYCQEAGRPFLAISAVTGQGLEELVRELGRLLGMQP